MKINFSKLTLSSTSIAFCVLAAVILCGLIDACASEVTFTTSKPISKRSYSETILPIKETPSPGGFWKTRREWKAYWVKDWTIKKIYVPVWKHVWGPTEVREWVPTGVAKPYPGKQHASIIH
ncbi:uncharacterized protein [Atheta coriaria]|uniref:uncharacterized protein n=1 Tax=Dalotia coriaria TaxID=877792 RepID=UPI0031F37B50